MNNFLKTFAAAAVVGAVATGLTYRYRKHLPNADKHVGHGRGHAKK